MLDVGVLALGVADVQRAARFWCAALDYEVRMDGFGARRIDWDSYPDDPDFIVLADPEGNIFCIVDFSHNRR